MASPKKIDWVAAEHEYITTKMSYADISKKYSVSLRLVNTYGSEHSWVEKRKDYLKKVSAKLVEKSEDMAVEKLLKIADVADGLINVIEETVNDSHQFKRYVITELSATGGQKTSEKIFEKTDTKAVRDIVSALRELTGIIRNVNEIPTQAEKEQREAAAERLRMEKEKHDAASGSNKDPVIEVVFDGYRIPWGNTDED